MVESLTIKLLLRHPIRLLTLLLTNPSRNLLDTKIHKSEWFWGDVRDQIFRQTDRIEVKAIAEPSGYFHYLVLYLLIKSLKPENVVETGVAEGISTSVILKALMENGKGSLFSIDLAATDPGRIGLVIPNSLRDRWHFFPGNSLEILPNLLAKLRTIDLFYHDSDHSYRHMITEYKLVWPYLTTNGILCSDDIDQNTAFNDFAQSVQPAASLRIGRLGLIVKGGPYS